MLYRIIPERNLLIDILEGDVDLQMLKHLFFVEVSDPDFVHVHRVVSDIRNAELKTSVNELGEFIKVLSTDNREKDFKWAIITDSPHSTALSILLRDSDSFRNIVEVFSGFTAASYFLGVSILAEDFEENKFKRID
jgi:hypothetical protein